MKIGVACGGTGGHIFPGLATARVLQSRGNEVALWLAGKQVETAAVQGWDGPVVTVSAEGFENGLSLRSVRSAWRLLQAVRTCTRAMRAAPPDVLLAMGSYASVGPLGAAWRCGVPFVLHEANVVPGRALQLFARRASGVAGCFEETAYHLKRADLVRTGMPLREAIRRAADEHRGHEEEAGPFRLLVMGGSGGARRLNEVVPDALALAHAAGRRLAITHLTGRAGEDAVRARYQQHGLAAEVVGFTHDMAALYTRSTLAVCRSGAATCAELGAFGLPSLLVPYPFAVRDHQMANARSMERAGAADVVADGDLTPAWLASYLGERMDRTERLREMRAAARSRGRTDGAEALADVVESCGRAGGGRGGTAG